MKYAVVQNTDGNFSIVSEWGENLDGAINAWHDQSKLLRNDKTTLKYTCKVVNEKFETVGTWDDTVDRTPAPEEA